MPLFLFSYLQILDALSTIACLILGGREANPVVQFAMSFAPNPIAGILIAKGVSILVGLCCWLTGRERALLRANLLFGLLIAWNLITVIIVGVAGR